MSVDEKGAIASFRARTTSPTDGFEPRLDGFDVYARDVPLVTDSLD